MLNKDNKLSKHYLDTSVTLNIKQMPVSVRRKDWEFRLIVTAQVKQAFNKTYANHFSGLFPRFLSNKLLLVMLSLQHKSFMILNGITKAKIFHKDISFQNMRINKNNKLIIYHFDIAIEPNSITSELQEKTSTIKFIAIDILNRESY